MKSSRPKRATDHDVPAAAERAVASPLDLQRAHRNGAAVAGPEATSARTRVPAVRADRLLALDVFRGVTIAAMILVNNPGSHRYTYAPLEHAVWNGCTPTDLIFPFFLFIVGVALMLSFSRRRRDGHGSGQLWGQIVRRTLIIFALGILLNGFPFFDWSTLRIPGVLQRIALCYFSAAVVVLTFGTRGQAAVTVFLLVGYWAAMAFVPIGGHAAGGLGPGHNLAAYIDSALLRGHLLHRRWDPEGLLSTAPAVATTLSGVLTADWLRTPKRPLERVVGLFVVGNTAVVAGLLMDLWFPINKSLWSSSYVVFTSGAAMSFLGVCYWLVDVRGFHRWTKPFVIFGTNPILAYVLSSLMATAMMSYVLTFPDGSSEVLRPYIFETYFLPLASPPAASLIYALLYVLLWLGITAILYRRRIFIKI